MVVFPRCKINLGLRILGRRKDGFHNISTLFYPVPFFDALEFIQAKETRLHLSGLPIEGKNEDNLCLKAFHLLKKDFPDLPFFDLYLHKVIPTGAGIGGGSSDAAWTLRALNKRCNLNLSGKQLISYATKLGSDCSFFTQDKPCLAEGKGEVLTPLDFDILQKHHLLLVCPQLQINTGEAYRMIQPSAQASSLIDDIQQPLSTWKKSIVNDFEKPVFKQHPYLKEIKETLYAKGAAYASLSGSGASVYGLFEKRVNSEDFSFKGSITLAFNHKVI